MPFESEIPNQHDAGGNQVKRVQQPDRPKRQAVDVDGVNGVSDITQHHGLAAIGMKVPGDDSLVHHWQGAETEHDGGNDTRHEGNTDIHAGTPSLRMDLDIVLPLYPEVTGA